MPHEMDRQQAAQQQAQQHLMMQHQLRLQQQQQYAAAYAQQQAQNQHWQQPTQNMGYASYGMAGGEFDKPTNGDGPAFGNYSNVDNSTYFNSPHNQAEYMRAFNVVNNPMYTVQQQQQQPTYGIAYQMTDRNSAANYNPAAPPPQQQQQAYARPPPAVKRAADQGDAAAIHGSPLSVFENQASSAAYTASWVSSTSSLPPDMKESPEDAHLGYHHGASVGGRGTVPGNEWVQPGQGQAVSAAAAAADYGGTWGERRDETMFSAVHAGGGGAGGATPFDHTQFARMNIDDTHAAYTSAALSQAQALQAQAQQQAGAAAAAAGAGGGGEWNSPEKNHPQQGIKFQNAWQTNNLGPNQPAPQPLMMLPQQPMHQQQNQHQKGGKPMGGFSPMGGKPQGHGGPRGDGGAGGYNKDNTAGLTWEERVKKAQGAKERAEGGRQFGGDANGGTNGGGGGGMQREGGGQRGGRGGGRGRGRGGERSYGGDRDGQQHGGGHHHQQHLTGGDHQRGGNNNGGGGWKGGPPPEAVAQAQQGGDAGAFPMMPFGGMPMQGGGWRGGMRGNGHGGHHGGYGGMRGGAQGSGQLSNQMQMQMRGAAAAAARGAVHPMMMRGPMGGGFPMMPPAPMGAGGPGGPGGPHGSQQDERFRSTWLDANMCLPALMGMPTPMHMNPMMAAGGVGGGYRGGPRGGFSSPNRGGGGGGFRGARGGAGGGGFRGGRPYYNNNRGDSPRQRQQDGEAEAKEDERSPVDSPADEAAAEEQQ